MLNLGSFLKISGRIALFLLLTAVTQIGGIAYLMAILITRTWLKKLAVFICLYSVLSLASIYVAPKFGRVAIPCFTSKNQTLKVSSPIYCALNRQYVTPKTYDLISALSLNIDSKFKDSQTLVLDANFPFFDGFPLLPHLSHKDGRKVDLAFYYRDKFGKYANGKTNSPIGYWAFEQPKNGSNLPCKGLNNILTMRWNMNFIQGVFSNYDLEPERTKEALLWLSTDGKHYGLEKIFVEPHIAQMFDLSNDTIRFQGCRAARHDDHIHVQTN